MRDKLNRVGYGFVVWAVTICLAVVLLASPADMGRADEGPGAAHHFWGHVTTNTGQPAASVEVTAWISGELKDTEITDGSGQYGQDPLAGLPVYLTVTGQSGDIIEFKVDGIVAEETRLGVEIEVGGFPEWDWQDLEPEWQMEYVAAEVNGLDLVYTPGNGGGGSPGGGGPSDTSNCKVVEIYATSSGKYTQDIGFASEDGNARIDIAKNTTGLNNGVRIYKICIDKNEDPPDTPQDYSMLGDVYDITPFGATFDPGLTLTMTFDDLPSGSDAGDMVITMWDGDAEEWVEIEDCVVNTTTGQISADIDILTSFVILLAGSDDSEADDSETDDSETDDSESDTSPGSDTDAESDTSDSDTSGQDGSEMDNDDGSDSTLPSDGSSDGDQDTPWPLIGGIAGGVVALGLIIYYVRRSFA